MIELSEQVAAVQALARASRLLERALPTLSLADFRVLSAVAEGEARASRLATRLALGKPAISSTVDSLVRRGLLARTVPDGDQRAVDLALTPDGERARSDAERTLVDVITELADDTDDPDAVLRSLSALGGAIERMQTSRVARVERAEAAPAAGSAAPSGAAR